MLDSAVEIIAHNGVAEAGAVLALRGNRTILVVPENTSITEQQRLLTELLER